MQSSARPGPLINQRAYRAASLISPDQAAQSDPLETPTERFMARLIIFE